MAKRLVLLASITSLFIFCFGLAAPAFAAAPTVQRIHSEGSQIPVQDCGTFIVLLSFSHDETITTFTDNSGNPVREQISFQFTGTLTNSVTGKTAYESGNYTIFTDFQTARSAGVVLLIRVPAQGVVLLELGSVTLDQAGNASLAGGPAPFQGEELICSILS